MTLKNNEYENTNRSLDKQNSPIFSNLNPAQVAAVEQLEGPMLIIAGAGSGKTRVLTHRIANLIDSGVNPWRIMALTFTNKAAQELRERIAGLVSEATAQKIWAGTFHSIFAKLLRFKASIIGYTSSFTIYDTDDSLSLVRGVLNSLHFSKEDFPPSLVRGRISWAKNKMISPEQYSQQAFSLKDRTIADIFLEYNVKLKNNNAMDFDDILLNMIKLLHSSSEVREELQNRFDFVLVDEYQDTNKAQYIAVKTLAEKHKNISVVGDDAQSIYAWRGAEIQNIFDFQKDFPNSTICRLEQNYRSTKNILGAAHSVIKNNKQQIPKELWTENEEGDLIELNEFDDDNMEADKIAFKIKSIIKEKNFEPKDFAVLYRTNAQSMAIENAFRKVKMPYVVIGGMSFFKRKEVKDTAAYLKLIANPLDSEALLRIVNEPPRGLGQTSLKHIINYSETKGISLLEAFGNAAEITQLQKRAINASTYFYRFITDNLSRAKIEDPIEFIPNFIAQTGLLDMYAEIDTEESQDRFNNIRQLIDDIVRYFKQDTEASLEDYLQQYSLIADIDEKDISQNQVKLMTLHAAKGLEFPVVFIAGLEQGLFPFERSDNNKKEIEEERRLFYVGITRACETLILSYCRRRMRFGMIQMQLPSQFLDELDKKYLKLTSKGLNKFDRENKSVLKSTSNVEFYDIPKKDSYSQIPRNYSNFQFKKGDKVVHPQFGFGIIQQLIGIADNKQALVNFKSVGVKKLMLKYANLEKI